jgi:predicted nucleotidyltransferase
VADATGFLRAPGDHGELLGRAVARLREDERVAALVLGGSLARGAPDCYSDIDLYVVVRDGAFDAVLAERDAIAGGVGSRLFAFDVDPVPGGSTDRIVLYEGPHGKPIKFDFMYLKESDLVPDPKWVGCAVLEDEGGRVGGVVARSEGLEPPPPKPEELRELNQKFWTLCWYVFGKIVRGELWEALDGLHNIRSLALVPLLDWAAKRPHDGYRRLEGKLNARTAPLLGATLSPLEPEALYAALRAEVELFRSLRAEVSGRHGSGFDPASEEALEAEMGRLWASWGGR